MDAQWISSMVKSMDENGGSLAAFKFPSGTLAFFGFYFKILIQIRLGNQKYNQKFTT